MDIADLDVLRHIEAQNNRSVRGVSPQRNVAPLNNVTPLNNVG
jgi:hypothetical protein